MKVQNIVARLCLFSAVLLAALPSSIQAQFITTTNNGTVTIVSYTGSGGAVVIPDTINGLPVVNIRTNAFYGKTAVTSVALPNTLTNLDPTVFSWCSGMTNITFGSGLRTIGNTAFYKCTGLKSLTIPDNVTKIDDGAFSYCGGLTNVTIGRGITNIQDYAFQHCTNLVSINIPAGVINIGDGAFYFCDVLKNVTIPSGVTNIGGDAFAECNGLTNIIIPNKVRTIGGFAFYSCTNLTSVVVPNSVTNIASAAFAFCTSLTNVTIGSGVIKMGDSIFYICVKLKSVYFYGNAPSIGSDPFNSANNAKVYYLAGKTGWGATFGGRPTALWNLQALTSGNSFGIKSNRFGFNIAGISNQVVVVEACTNLTNPVWFSVSTNTLTDGSTYFGDSNWMNYPGRFYRLRLP